MLFEDAASISKIIGRRVTLTQTTVDAVQVHFLFIFSFYLCIKAGGPFQIIKTLRLPFWKRSPYSRYQGSASCVCIVIYYYVILRIILLIIKAIIFHSLSTYLFWFVYLSYFVLVFDKSSTYSESHFTCHY